MLSFTADSATVSWPSSCSAGVGSATVPFVSSTYDGTFYLDNVKGQCMRLIVGGTSSAPVLYRSMLQASNQCPNADVTSPSCGPGGGLIFETYTPGSPACRQTVFAGLVIFLGTLLYM